MSSFDVIVVGSGPGGSTAAYELARAGVETLVLEKDHHPRYKPCGGGLTRKVDRILPFPLDPVLEQRICGVLLTCRGQQEMLFSSTRPIATMVLRDRFDHFLVKKAREAGAQVVEGQRLVSLESEGGRWRVLTTGGSYTARYLVGADGVHSQVRRSLFPRQRPRLSPAIESEMPVAPAVLDGLRGHIRVDFGQVPYGYGWVFPKTNQLSVGVGGFLRPLTDPKAQMDAYVRQQPLGGPDQNRDSASTGDTALSEPPRRFGYAIPTYHKAAPLTHGRGLLIGDAGGLVDPFFGEGIYYAMRSGQMASGVLTDALRRNKDLSGYEEQVRSEIYPEFEAARRIGRWVYAAPRLLHRFLIANPELAVHFFASLGEVNGYQRFWKEIQRKSMRVLWRSAKRKLWEAAFKSSRS